MYFDYLREREPDTHILERDYGFALYQELTYHGERAVYIKDIYVLPEFREQHKATEMSEEIQKIAKDNDIKYLLGSVAPSAEGSHRSLLVLLAHGMRLEESGPDLIWFVKEID